MDDKLSGKVIVITGASSGFGKGVALKLAQSQTNLVIAARRKQLLDEVVVACEQSGSQALAVACDVSIASGVEEVANAALRKFGRIDVWINNAGGAVIGDFVEVPLYEHEQVIKTDLLGTMYGSYFAMNQFRKNNSGILINVASMIGKVPAPYYSAYSAAKHGVVGFSAALRQELQEQNIKDIHVCTVMPMAMDTPFFEHAANYSGHEAVPIPPLDDAQKVIDIMVDLISNPKDEVPIGMGSGVSMLFHQMAPGAMEGMMAKNTHKAQMEDAPVSEMYPGSLMYPDSSGTGVKGTDFAA